MEGNHQDRSESSPQEAQRDLNLANDPLDVRPTLPALSGYRLPAETVSHILSYIVADGYQVSNDPAHDSESFNPEISALLKASINIKNELLRQIFAQPLRIYISNGKDCGCNEEWQNAAIDTPLIKKLTRLPLHRWPSVTVTFAPKFQESPCVDLNQDHFLHAPRFEALSREARDPLGWKFLYAIHCLNRLSQLVAIVLYQFGQPETETRPKLTTWTSYNGRSIRPPSFQFNDAQQVNRISRIKIVLQDTSKPEGYWTKRELPLWDMGSILSLLAHWRWAPFGDVFDQIEFPSLMAMALGDIDAGTVQAGFPDDIRRFLARFRTQLSTWWGMKRLMEDYWIIKPVDMLRHPLQGRDWYFSMTPLRPNSTRGTIQGAKVLLIQVHRHEQGEEGGCKSAWEGQLVASDP